MDAIRRLEGMIMMAGLELPSSIIREYIVGALDFIVQIERLQDGQRKMVASNFLGEGGGKGLLEGLLTSVIDGIKGLFEW